MSIYRQFQRDADAIDEQLRLGEIEPWEHAREMAELERDARDAEREEEERAIDEIRDRYR